MIGTIKQIIKGKGRLKMNEETFFVVCNIPRLLEKMLKDIRDQSGENMTKENLDGYDYAVETALSMIKQIVHSSEMGGETLVHSDKISDKYDSEEFDLQGLLELLGCRVIAQFSEREGEE